MTETIKRKLSDSSAARWTAMLIVSFTMMCGYFITDVMSPLGDMLTRSVVDGGMGRWTRAVLESIVITLAAQWVLCLLPWPLLALFGRRRPFCSSSAASSSTRWASASRASWPAD